jgi:hypothetical protein
MPLKSTIHVYEVRGEERVYEAVTDDSNSFYGAHAVQKSGPPLQIIVAEHRFKVWSGVGSVPSQPSREHTVRYQVDGVLVTMPRIAAPLESFLLHGNVGEVAYLIGDTVIVNEEA